MSCLNDRLAQYIDKVRRLELENQKLLKTMVKYETQKSESDKMSDIYTLELNEAKNLMQEMSDENEQLRQDTRNKRENFAKMTEKLEF
uniref:IF rod domain-containing protein n=1 Tax=Romanomermis culicivorax TaxID=13658 RepID=A0A915JL11_ROMCU